MKSVKVWLPALLAGIAFGFPLGFGYSLEASAASSIGVGVLGGVLVALAFGAYLAWSNRRWDTWVAKTLAPYEADGIVHHGRASPGDSMAAFGGLAAFGLSGALFDRGGLLVLTKRRLLFVPHRHNLLGKQFELPVENIAGARAGYGIMPNTIVLATSSKQSLQLKVRNRDKWLAKLPGVKVSQ